jgi:hypothetical protein
MKRIILQENGSFPAPKLILSKKERICFLNFRFFEFIV